MPHHPELKKTLTFQDLVFFGIASILGSGGFNLVGQAIAKGGDFWPLSLAAAGALFFGSSKTYEIAFNESKQNTAESDFVEKIFGKIGANLTTTAILGFNILSLSTILVLCSHLLFPKGTWTGQILFALFLLGGMTVFALRGLNVNKELINSFMILLLIFLVLITGLGFTGLFKNGTVFSQENGKMNQSFAMSLLFFYFILAGFDALIKFTEEAKEKKDIPRSFYWSNFISFFLVLGLCFAIVSYVDLKNVKNYDNIVGDLVNSFLGNNTDEIIKYMTVIFMLVTTFVTFLATTRYLFSYSEKVESLKIFTTLNEVKAPVNSIYATCGIAGLGILMNHTETLVRLCDFSLSTQLVLVAAAAAVKGLKDGKIPWLEGTTAAGFAGLMGLSIMK
jgi:L-asparagine transporter-like permease